MLASENLTEKQQFQEEQLGRKKVILGSNDCSASYGWKISDSKNATHRKSVTLTDNDSINTFDIPRELKKRCFGFICKFKFGLRVLCEWCFCETYLEHKVKGGMFNL